MALCDWAGLPEDLLLKIHQLLSLVDLNFTSAVCPSWRAASAIARRLILPPGSPCFFYQALQEPDPNTATVYSITDKKLHKVYIPGIPFAKRVFIGSSYGWLIFVDNVGNLHLLNPITGRQIALPPASTFEHIKTKVNEAGNTVYKFHCGEKCTHNDGECEVHLMHKKYYRKAVLTSDPSKKGGDDYMVVVIHAPCDQLSYVRAGEEKWTRMAGSNDHQAWYVDCTHCWGVLYAMQIGGTVHTFDFSGDLPVRTRIIDASRSRGIGYIMTRMCEGCVAPLPNGDVLKIGKGRLYKQKEKFYVFRVDPAHNCWFRNIDDLGGCTMLVQIDNTQSDIAVPVSLSDFPQLAPDHLYFLKIRRLSSKLGHRDFTVSVLLYNVKDFSTKKDCDSIRTKNRPIWMVASTG